MSPIILTWLDDGTVLPKAKSFKREPYYNILTSRAILCEYGGVPGMVSERFRKASRASAWRFESSLLRRVHTFWYNLDITFNQTFYEKNKPHQQEYVFSFWSTFHCSFRSEFYFPSTTTTTRSGASTCNKYGLRN